MLPHLAYPKRYVPIDISGELLEADAQALHHDHPWLEVQPVVADFTEPAAIQAALQGIQHGIGLYFGSSLGNFNESDAISFLEKARAILKGGSILVGMDLVKDPAVLHAAYNDAAGVTAAFNMNMLVRANRELQADFNTSRFVHHACYNPGMQRIEMHLISMESQVVHVQGRSYEFQEGESLHTENSYKFTLSGFRELIRLAGLHPGPVWMDPKRWFALHWLDSDAHPKRG